jgi:hypothetical protein
MLAWSEDGTQITVSSATNVVVQEKVQLGVCDVLSTENAASTEARFIDWLKRTVMLPEVDTPS